MKIFISEADRQSARRIAIKNIARFLNLPDWESKPNEELYNDIAVLTDKPAVSLFKLLKEYFKAYDEWFTFYQERKKIGNETLTEYDLNGKEQKELQELINKRQSSLNTLQAKFDELQLSKFNKQTFGNDISGILNNQQI